jgi:small conductance mechanosensitive channel
MNPDAMPKNDEESRIIEYCRTPSFAALVRFLRPNQGAIHSRHSSHSIPLSTPNPQAVDANQPTGAAGGNPVRPSKMTNLRRGSLTLFVAIAVSLLLAGNGLADTEPDEKALAKAESDLEKFQSLSDSRSRSLLEAAALEGDAATSSGSDQVALRSRALELRLKSEGALIEMGTLVDEMKSREVDVTSQIRQVAALMPGFWRAIQSDYADMLSARDGLVAARADISDEEGLAALEPQIARYAQMFVRLLSLGVEGLELSERLGVPAEAQKKWLTGHLLVRARLTASHLTLAFEQQSDLAERVAAGADPAALAPAQVAATHRIATATEILRSLLGLMGRLELDTSEYANLLVQSTGELTVEAIDRDVISEILSSWVREARESVESGGAGYAFSTLLFLVIMTTFYLLSRVVRRIVTKAVEARHLRFSELLKRTVISLSSGTMLAIGFLIALSQLGIQIAPMLAGLGIAGFVLGFALQDTLANFAAGLMVLLYRPYDVGDMIDCAGGTFGKVSHMSLVSTTILTIDNKTLIVPNNKIWGDVITNVTAQNVRRVDLEFGIGYGDDIPKAEKILSEVLAEHPKVLADPEAVVKLHSLGDSSVNFVVRPWVETDDYWDVHWDVTREVKLRFDREGVSIPFPQRDVHLYPVDPGSVASADSDGAASAPKMEIGSTSADAHDEPDSEET